MVDQDEHDRIIVLRIVRALKSAAADPNASDALVDRLTYCADRILDRLEGREVVAETPDEARRRRIAEGTRRGLDRARAEGRHPGRPRTMPAKTIARLRALRAEGLSYRAIAKRMNAENVPHPYGVRWSAGAAHLALLNYGE